MAHVRVIFRLPEVYNLRTTHPLAYVEWMTPFRPPDALTGMYTVSRSSRMHHAYAEIIEADCIVRNCHLLPKHGRVKEADWTAENVADLCRTFYVNSYIDYHSFCLFRLNHNDCI